MHFLLLDLVVNDFRIGSVCVEYEHSAVEIFLCILQLRSNVGHSRLVFNDCFNFYCNTEKPKV